MLPVTIAGYLTTQLIAAGVNPMTVFATLVPHSIFEIPAAVLAAAAALKMGAVVISPPPNKTLGQAWMEALAEATRLWVTVILPLLLIAAIIEITVTPQLVSWLARGG
jgi:stage II sporulation protein M